MACVVSLAIATTSTASVAVPVGGVVSAGEATIHDSAGRIDIHQQSDKAVIDWREFDLNENETAQFHQPDNNALTVNRVNSVSPSIIHGNLKANGNVMVINPNGMLFGGKALVDVNGLIASTADASNADLMRHGALSLNKSGNPNAIIVNLGHIKTKDGGYVSLLAPNISNQGIIEANLGSVALASGDTATVDLYGDNLILAAVSDKVTSQIIENHGIIAAQGGSIAISAAAGEMVVDSLINLDGLLDAKSVGDKTGNIIVQAEGSNAVKHNIAEDKGKRHGSSNVFISGVIDVSGRNTGERGGNIAITGDNIALLGDTLIDASGSDGLAGTTEGKAISDERVGAAGGDIRIGGDYLGQGSMPAAKNLYVDEGVYVLNDALRSGDAGRTIFWSDGITEFYGNVFARALGAKPVDIETWDATPSGNKGDGGFVETSGYGYLDAAGYVNLTASNGVRGTYLLDPTDITIYGFVTPTFNSTDNAIDLNGASNDQLSLWLDANDSATISATSGAVDSWSDKSGFNNTASGTLTARPTTGTRTINGLNVIKFDGSNDELIALDSASLDVSGAFSTFIINSIDTVTNPAGLLSKRVASSNNDAFSFLYLVGGRLNTDVNTANNRFAGNTAYSAGGTQYHNIIFNGSLAAANRVSVYDSGLLDITANEASATIPNYASNLTIGRLAGNASSFFNGVIGEVLIYNTALGTNARHLVDQYLSAKWNKALTAPGTSGAGTTEALKAMASTARAGDTVDGYSVFSTRYLERLGQSANIDLKASNNIVLDLKTDTLNLSRAGTSITLDAGNQIRTQSAGNITTNNGTINLTGTGGIVLNHSLGLTTNGGNINFNNNLQLGANQNFNSGTGTTNFTGSVNGIPTVQVLAVAGGGGGGANGGGGGGGGGVLHDAAQTLTQLSAYTVTVGTGGAGSVSNFVEGSNGGNSSFGTLTAIGGGGGASRDGGAAGQLGGSGGGGAGAGGGRNAAGAGTAGQGNSGGAGTGNMGANSAGGGGGGAGGVGSAGASTVAGNGGAGIANSITGTSVTYGGGGGGGITVNGTRGLGGAGGGGNGGQNSPAITATAGTANTGGGGGGGGGTSAAGGSGVVIVRHAGTAANANVTGGTSTTVGGDTVWTFNSSGSFAPVSIATPYNLTVNAGTISFGGAVGGVGALNAVSLTSANALTLPTITSSTLLARTTATSANITIPASRVITATGTGTPLTLAAGGNFINNGGNTALSASSGRWLVYAANDTANVLGGLSSNFVQYSCSYVSCGVSATGNGFLYANNSASGNGTGGTSNPFSEPIINVLPPFNTPVGTILPPTTPNNPNNPVPVVVNPPTPTPATLFSQIPASVQQVSQDGSALITSIPDDDRNPSVRKTAVFFSSASYRSDDQSNDWTPSNGQTNTHSESENDNLVSLWNGLLAIDPALAKKLDLETSPWME